MVHSRCYFLFIKRNAKKKTLSRSRFVPCATCSVVPMVWYFMLISTKQTENPAQICHFHFKKILDIFHTIMNHSHGKCACTLYKPKRQIIAFLCIHKFKSQIQQTLLAGGVLLWSGQRSQIDARLRKLTTHIFRKWQFRKLLQCVLFHLVTQVWDGFRSMCTGAENELRQQPTTNS